MTNEIDRLKILEDKITGVIDQVYPALVDRKRKPKQLVKDLKAEKRDSEDLVRKVVKLDGSSKIRKMKGRNEGEDLAIISQIDKLGT